MTKRGRPRSNKARRTTVTVRLNEKEKELFVDLCSDLGIPMADLVREAVLFYSQNKDEID